MAKPCYFPSGDPAPRNVPCNNGTEFSTCCSDAKFCLTNGLCLVNNDPDTVEFARGACTDSTWSSSNCFQQCLLTSYGVAMANGAAVFECDTVGYNAPAEYCCESSAGTRSQCCQNQALRFALGAGTPIGTQTIGLAAATSSTSLPRVTPGSWPANGATLSIIAPYFTSITTFPTSISSTTFLNTVNTTSPEVQISTSTSIGTTSTSLPSQESDTNSGLGTQVGISVGAVGGLVLLLALVFIWIVRRQFAKYSLYLKKSTTSPETVENEESGITADGDRSRDTLWIQTVLKHRR